MNNISQQKYRIDHLIRKNKDRARKINYLRNRYLRNTEEHSLDLNDSKITIPTLENRNKKIMDCYIKEFMNSKRINYSERTAHYLHSSLEIPSIMITNKKIPSSNTICSNDSVNSTKFQLPIKIYRGNCKVTPIKRPLKKIHLVSNSLFTNKFYKKLTPLNSAELKNIFDKYKNINIIPHKIKLK